MMNKGQKSDALMDFDPKKFEENNEHKNLFEVLEALEADQKYFLMLELKVFLSQQNFTIYYLFLIESERTHSPRSKKNSFIKPKTLSSLLRHPERIRNGLET